MNRPILPLRCADCGYPKAGVKGTVCPECGCERVLMRGRFPISGWTLLIPLGVLLSPGIWFLGVLHWLNYSGTTDAQSGLMALGPFFSVPFALLAAMIWVACVPGSSQPGRGIKRRLHRVANILGVAWIGFFVFLAISAARSPGW